MSLVRGIGPYADLIERRFNLACKKLGLNKTCGHLDVTKFSPPKKDSNQLSLF